MVVEKGVDSVEWRVAGMVEWWVLSLDSKLAVRMVSKRVEVLVAQMEL